MFDVSEKPKRVERALLVGVHGPGDAAGEVDLLLDELEELVDNLGVETVHRETVKIRAPQSRFLMGKGRAAEVVGLAGAHRCDCIVFDNELTPAQQRNWEKESGLCVIDRQEVILDIFADRAQTREAVLQVELARMQYNLPRLKRAWTHLDRQRGGGITQRGEGEAQIEIDARLVRARIARLKEELKTVVKHRSLQRKQRLKKPVPTAALVGYTNAGKSSLLNALTGSAVLVEDKLFATLDPTTRRLELPRGQELLLSDTVGFVRRLPHRLIDAFKATLEEALVSDFLVHVLDASSPEVDAHRETTLEVLEELGADRKRILTVYNKIDLVGPGRREELTLAAPAGTCLASARTGEGRGELLAALEAQLEGEARPAALLIPHGRYDLIARFHQIGHVEQEEHREEGVFLQGNLPRRAWAPFAPYSTNGVVVAPAAAGRPRRRE